MQFAVSFLGYKATETLPPTCASDVMKFIALFSSAGTAKNYVGVVAWACKYHGLSLAWRRDEVNLALQGLKKAEQASDHQILKEVKLMMPEVMLQLTHLCNTLPGFQSDCDLFLLAWQLLLRVQSEAVPMQIGEFAEQDLLPGGRHSALWVHSRFVCHLRLKRRKHMPAGSTMARPCICTGLQADALCLKERLSSMQTGAHLSYLTASQFVRRFRNLLSLYSTFQAPIASVLKLSGRRKPSPSLASACHYANGSMEKRCHVEIRQP